MEGRLKLAEKERTRSRARAETAAAAVAAESSGATSCGGPLQARLLAAATAQADANMAALLAEEIRLQVRSDSRVQGLRAGLTQLFAFAAIR